jgi:hypothetical protein
MDFQRFEFIYCANNEQQLQESLNHNGALDLPAGYTAGSEIVRNASSMVRGYNQAMRRSDAKYKIYLHQDVNIINRNFLHDILALFKKFPNLALLGMLGAKRLPPNGVWWDAEKHCGKVQYFNHLLTCNTEVTGDYESVQVVDGMIMITQYDLPWREDLLTGWHFYDSSQSLEFIKAGYTVGVPRQSTPWCAHNCVSSILSFQVYQQIFRQEYGQFLAR